MGLSIEMMSLSCPRLSTHTLRLGAPRLSAHAMGLSGPRRSTTGLSAMCLCIPRPCNYLMSFSVLGLPITKLNTHAVGLGRAGLSTHAIGLSAQTMTSSKTKI